MPKLSVVRDHAAGRARRTSELAQFLAKNRERIDQAIVVYCTVDGKISYETTTTNRLILSGLLGAGDALVWLDE